MEKLWIAPKAMVLSASRGRLLSVLRRLKALLSALWKSLRVGKGQGAGESTKALEEFTKIKCQIETSYNEMLEAGDSLTREAMRLGLAVQESSLLHLLKLNKRAFEQRIRPHLQRFQSVGFDPKGDGRGGGLIHKTVQYLYLSRFSEYHQQFESTRSSLELARELLLKYGSQAAFASVLPLRAALDAPEFVAVVCRAAEERVKLQSELVPLLRSSVDSRLEVCERHISLISECGAASEDDIDGWRRRLSELKAAKVAGWDNRYNDLLSLQDKLDPLIHDLEDLSQKVISARILEASSPGWQILCESELFKQKGRKAKSALLSLKKPYQQS
ncbi:MAG: hypothetical protein FGF53_09035, partial [Candidatus Brockarchaeota archaeon]|nr:hypothetical protein [Candidatus Brockarchaeota archaeon]